MKTCPICQALAFDDARVCFSCMHRYDEAEQRVENGSGEQLGRHADAGVSPSPSPSAIPYFPADAAIGSCLPADAAAGAYMTANLNAAASVNTFADAAASTLASADAAAGVVVGAPVPAPAQDPAPPAFFIRLSPILEEAGGVRWACSVDLAG